MKKIFLSILAASLVLQGSAFSNPAPAVSGHISLKAAAIAQCHTSASNEFAKLLCLGEMLKHSPFEVVYNGKAYSIQSVSSIVKAYILMNYRRESAQDWIEKYAYRSQQKNEIIYLKDPTGKLFILKDVLLQGLKDLPVA